jgi:formaldehyde-activating enzyme involved in methanogenesis
MAKSKHKSMRNQPEMYNEIKQPFTLSLTRTAVSKLDYHAKIHGISRSEVVEQFARSLEENLLTQVAFLGNY